MVSWKQLLKHSFCVNDSNQISKLLMNLLINASSTAGSSRLRGLLDCQSVNNKSHWMQSTFVSKITNAKVASSVR
jgi:hypothetical protein